MTGTIDADKLRAILDRWTLDEYPDYLAVLDDIAALLPESEPAITTRWYVGRVTQADKDQGYILLDPLPDEPEPLDMLAAEEGWERSAIDETPTVHWVIDSFFLTRIVVSCTGAVFLATGHWPTNGRYVTITTTTPLAAVLLARNLRADIEAAKTTT